MCGLAGAFLYRATQDQHVIEKAVHRMCDRMQARGPDAQGYWSDSKVGLSLGHRRLSILDLETRGMFLARDPYGIKPLYIGRCKDGWLFTSQVKALLASGLISHDPDPQGQ